MVFTASFAPLARSSPALFLRSAAAQTAGATRSFSSSGSATTVPDSGTTAPAALSPEEALYLAKEAGFYTKQELQEQIIRSPPFSKSRSPFLLEDFLAPLPVEDKIVGRFDFSNDFDFGPALRKFDGRFSVWVIGKVHGYAVGCCSEQARPSE